MYLVTGGNGFIGKHLVDQLLKRKGTIYILVWEPDRDRYEVVMQHRWAAFTQRIKPVFGDTTKVNLGLDADTITELKANVQHFYHMAALSDLKANAKSCQQINVKGTENAVEFANQLGATFHYLSTIYVAGDFAGTFTEDMTQEGQDTPSPYATTKLQAEIIVRERAKVPFRIYRPGIVVGSSTTGEAEKTDGPYYVFKIIQALGKVFPQWVPMFGVEGGQWHLVPVDYVGRTIDYISHKKGLDNQTFHLVDEPIKVIDVINEFCKVAHAPQFSAPGSRLISALPWNLASKIPFGSLVQQQLFEKLELPENFKELFQWKTDFDHKNTENALKGSKIVCPPLKDYSRVLWYFWEAHMSPILSQNRKKPGMTHALIQTPEVITGGRSIPEFFKDQWEQATSRGMENLERLISGKIIMITGGSSGIGLAMAHRLAKAHGTVILVARTLDKLEIAKQEVEQMGGTAYVYSCDLSDPEAIGELVNKVMKDHGRVDILINNAGRSIRRPIHLSYDRFHDYQRTMNLNYFGCLKLILGFMPGMRERKYGHIINISSIGCQTNVPRFSAYVASKSALDAFSRSIASEVVHDNVTLTTVYMPLVRTPMIGPTKMYDHVPTLTPDQAAKLALYPLVTKDRKAATPMGTAVEILHAISPKTANVLLNLGFRLFPDGEPGDGETPKLSAESIAFAYLSRGIHW
ncbi:MAG: SDR family NAD(P)-dependent oxidoreductase [SAR324 cluster bacterium]|nr:SDR family NAD(P)-dependent oxidoreductase [SAR324 cluster bacterium]